MESRKPKSITKKSDFFELKTSGKKINLTKWLFISYKENKLHKVRYAVILSRKIGSSVVRNKLRRWCREYIRINKDKIGNIDINIIFKPMTKDFYKNMDYQMFSKSISNLAPVLVKQAMEQND